MNKIQKELGRLRDKENAELLQRFFKTGKGEYGEGDIFLGINVPKQREIAKRYWKEASLYEINELLNSKIHEHRQLGLFILIEKYNLAKKSKNQGEQKKIVDFYLKHVENNHVNNWDLVDLSAHKILGDWLVDKKSERKILYKLAKSNNLWEKRVSIISCFAFLPNKDLDDAIKLSKVLLKDKHDLMHKAVGWVLREIGKKEVNLLQNFLKKNYNEINRTTLRYAIEKFPEGLRIKFLRKEYE